MVTMLRVSSTKTIISGNGSAVSTGDGRRLAGYDNWRMSWNGNMFAPPSASGCVLYLPGHPGQGSTITDFSSNFLDSTINTDDALTDTETDVTCGADATTLIPAGSIIRIEEELMAVTATGLTLTVVRGYSGSLAVAHDTPKDVYIRTANHGTISGATWVRLPSGLPGLSFDGTGDIVTVTSAAGDELDITGDFSMLVWGLPTTANKIIMGRWGVAVTQKGYFLTTNAAGRLRCQINDAAYEPVAGASLVNTGNHLMGVTLSGTDLTLYVDGASYHTATSVIPASINQNFLLGKVATETNLYVGTQYLPRLLNVVLTAAQIANIWIQERHLFGV